MRTCLLLIVSLCAAGLWTGCGREEATEPEVPVPADTPTAPGQPPAAGMPQQPAQPEVEFDTVVADRAIAFAEGQLARQNYSAVRESLLQLQNMKLTPAQRQRVDAIRAKLPPQ